MQSVRLAELPTLAEKILRLVSREKSTATIITLTGELGSGKTALTQALARCLGVVEPVQSPTYVVMRRYALPEVPLNQGRFDTLLHLDLYRLEGPAAFAALKPEQFLSEPKTLVVIEWPEQVGDALPVPDLALSLSLPPEGDAEGDERYIEGI